MIALLDWELSTRGHPLSDLANLLQPLSLDCSDVSIVNDPEGGEKARAKGEMFQFLGGLDPEISPIPSKEELMRTYCEAVGRPYPIQDWSFCEAWGWFRVSSALRLPVCPQRIPGPSGHI